jgi:putative ATPase subunit of terminase (gpP-like)|nr:MAG TPA: Putative ATPase subunit of terminase (gpP like) [Caudoviricetes sp.]
MGEKADIKQLARELYLKGFSVEKIAEILNKSTKTIKNYKTSDGKWDEQKTAGYLNKNGEDKQNIYQNFIEEMRLAVKDIRESELSASKKADALSKIGDSFVKMSKVASYENPAAYRLSIAKKVIMLVVDKFKDDENKECIKKLVELIESEKFIKAIEELDA